MVRKKALEDEIYIVKDGRVYFDVKMLIYEMSLISALVSDITSSEPIYRGYRAAVVGIENMYKYICAAEDINYKIDD